jgi:hypothetical protein
MIKNFIRATILLSFSFLFVTCNKKAGEKDAVVTFRTVSLNEQHHLNGDVKNPVLSIELTFQYPAAFSNDRVLKKIRATMLADFLPEVNDTSSQPENVMKSYIKERVKLYESSGDIVRDEDSGDVGDAPQVAWKDNTKLLIRCNGKGLLSYTIESTQFSGGAHGGITFRNAVVDLKTGEKLKEEDLFNEASLPLINSMILKKLEMQNKVETPEDLEQIGYFDVTQISQYKNFYLTDQGLTYTFNEGEIGAYALGTIEVKLSFQDLEGLALPGSPLEKLIP